MTRDMSQLGEGLFMLSVATVLLVLAIYVGWWGIHLVRGGD